MNKDPLDKDHDFIKSKNANLVTNPSSRMISFSKQKEYARLAANVPGVYNVEQGKKVLQEGGQQD